MTAPNERLAAGLAECYRIERELGAGRMATVYLAEDLKHKRKVALKVLKPELSAVLGPDRFLKEIELTASLQHPHILPLFDSGSADGQLFYVMPFVDGETLRTRLERERQLPVANAVRLATEVADALSYAHGRGVVHRDIKPENILLQGGHALVADFGIALAMQQAGGQRMTQTGLSLGTPQYMSPEQAMGEKAVDARTDIYALGTVTYEMLTGEPPFSGPTVQSIVAKVLAERPMAPTALRETIPPGVEDAVLTALAKLPADRFASAAEFAAALGADAPAKRHQVAAQAPASSPADRASARTVVTVGALALATAAALWGWLRPNATDGATVYDAALPDTAPMSLGAASAITIYGTASTNLSISANGKFAVYPALVGDSLVLWRRSLIDASSGPIRGAAGAVMARISPDGGRVAFVGPGEVLVMPIAGGAPRRLSNAGAPVDLQWVSPTRLLLLHSDGYRFNWLDPEVGETGPERTIPRCLFGKWIEADRTFLCAFNGIARVVDPETGTEQTVRIRNADGSPGSAVVGSTFRLVDGRYLVYVSLDGELRAAPYDRPTRLAGRSVTLLTGVRREAFGAAQYDLSANGTLVYAPGVNAEIGRLVRFRPGGGAPEPLPIERGAILRYDLSRDRRWIAAVLQRPQTQELRIYDLRDGRSFAWLKADYFRHPLWSPDGQHIVVWVQSGQRSAIISGSPFTASAPDTLVAASAPASLPDPIDYADEHTVLAQDWSAAVAFRFDPTVRPVRLDSLVTDAKFVKRSPDGRRLVYQTADASRLIVTSFPPNAERHQVGADGVEALWLSSTELLYRTGVSWQLVHLDPATGEAVGSPTVWAQDPRFSDTAGWSHRLSHDGGIIYLQGPEQTTAQYLRVIPNWVTTMKAAVDSANRRY